MFRADAVAPGCTPRVAAPAEADDSEN